MWHNDIIGTIGNTPLVRINKLASEFPCTVVAKVEFYNPGGSVKDRIGVGMIRAAEREGLLGPGATIVEPTAGNTGVALALAGVQLGYRVILVVPEQYSMEKRELMKALGGEVVLTPEDEGMKGAIARAEAIAADTPGSYLPQQFRNPFNSQVHYETTGAEIWQQMEERVDGFVAGSGTGGTFTGVARYLKERNPALIAIVVEPEGSVLGGGESGPHEVEGIGSSFIPEVLDLDLADEIVLVPDPPAFAMVARLAREEGILAGSSAGANVHAAAELARRLGPGRRVVTLIPDGAERYMSTGIYSKWTR